MSRRGLLVDWGGVLTTSPFTALEDFARAEGLPGLEMRPALAPGGALHEPFAALEAGTIDDAAFEHRLAAALGLPPDRASGLRRRMFATMRSDHATRRAVFACRARGVRTGLLSNSVGAKSYDPRTLEELFDVRVISGEVGVRKPDPEIYRLAVERMALPPEELVFVDDLEENLAPAAALGIATVLHTDAAMTLAALERLLPLPITR